jgi:hypothetical protein
VPLFATIDDQNLALIQNDTFTSPEAVLAMRGLGIDDGCTVDINIVWMPKDTPRFSDNDGTVFEHVIGHRTINENPEPPKIVFTSKADGKSGAEIGPQDVVLEITPNIPFDELSRRILEAASQLPDKGRLVHEYDPLDSSSGEIRLVKILPNEGNTSVQCELLHARLEEKPSYEALSYTWGDPQSHGNIELHGLPFFTRENLEAALRRLRLKERPRILWVDALCIDQINIEERNAQVGLMRDIYKGASRVLIFLGLAENDSDVAMDLINGDLDAGCDEAEVPHHFELRSPAEETEIVEEYIPDTTAVAAIPISRVNDGEHDYTNETYMDGHDNTHSFTALHGRNLTRDMFTLEDGEAEVPREFEYFSDDNEDQKDDRERNMRSQKQRVWTALNHLIRRPWWTRVWVLQEVVISETDPLIYCGNRTAHWKQFADFLSTHCAISSHASNMLANMSIQQRVAISANYRTQTFLSTRKNLKKMSIYKLLVNTMTLNATDARDKVFALIGLAVEKDRQKLAPDYSKSVAQVYAETAKHIITSTGLLDILSFNTNSEIDENGMLPSWAPDWRLGASRPYPLYHWGLYRASGTLPACVFPSCVGPSSGVNSLTLGGILVDEVSDVSDVIMSEHQPSPTSNLSWKSRVRKLEELLLRRISLQSSRYGSDRTNPAELAAWRKVHALDPDPRNSDQFWRTLVVNSSMENKTPAPAVFAEMFEMLFYQGDDAPIRRVIDEGLRSRVGFTFPRLQTPQPSGVPQNYLPGLPYDERVARYTRPLVTAMARLSERVLFVTKSNSLGVAYKGVRAGDKIVILMGGDMPFILRDRDKGQPLQFIGESYVHGMMNGEVLSIIPRGDKIEKHMMFFPLG